MRNKLMFPALLILMLVVTACGSAAPTVMPATAMPATAKPATAAPATMAAQATPITPAIVNDSQNAAQGSILVDSMGMSLYMFTKDTPGSSTCYSTCASYWPPYLSNGAPVSGMGLTASLLGTTTRTDGTVQVTYNGWPLYHYAKDKLPGDTTGEGSKSTWYLVTPDGKQK